MPIPPGATQVAGKIVTTCWKIYSAWKEKTTKVQQAELDKIIAELQAGKTLGRRVGEGLSRSLQSLRLSSHTVEALRLLDADAVFHGSAADCLQAGVLSSEELARLLRESSLGATCPPHELESVAALWLDAIDLTIGGNAALSNALLLKSTRKIESTVSDISESSQIIITETREIRQAQEVVNNIGLENLAINRDMLEIVRRLEEKVSTSSQTYQAQSILQKQLQSRFERCRDHLLFGSVDLAETEFVDLIAALQEAGEVGSRDLLFRSHLNHSSCLLLQNKIADAKEALEQARQICPDDKKYLRHLATLMSYERRNTEALEIIQKLRVLDPEDPKNIADEIALLCDLKQHDKLSKLIDSVDIEDADVQCQKAHALMRLGRHEESVAAARKAVQIQPESEGPWVALAYTIGFPVVDRCENVEHPQLCPTDEDAARMSDAIEAAQKAEAILQKRSRKSLLQEVRANLLAFYILSSRIEEGVMLAMKMEVSTTTSEVALGNLYSTFLLSGKSQKALEVAKQMVVKLGTYEARMKKANAHVLAGEGALALSELEGIKSTNQEIVDNPMWVVVTSNAYHSLHQADEALKVLQIGINDHPESVELYLAAAKRMAEMRKDDQALVYFQQAEKLAPNNFEVLSYFGQYLYFNEDWGGALERFEKIGARSLINPLFPRLVASLFNTGKFDDCLDCVRSWRSVNPEVEETVFGVGSRAAMALDEWQLARELLESLVRSGGPRHFANLKLLAKVYLRLDDHQEAYTLFSQAVPEASKDVEALTLLAQVCAACGKHSEALQRHAQSIAANPASIPARAAFFGTMLALPEGFEPSPEILRLHHENIPILTSDPSGVLRAIRVQKDDGEFDFSNIQQELDKNAKAVSEVLEYSRQNPMPLRFIVEDLGVKMYEGWRAFTCDVERGVRMCSGTIEEQKSQIRAVDLSRSVSVDLIALFTLHGLGQLGLLTRMFDQVFVHISILDDVVRELNDTLTWPSSGKLGSVNGQMIMIPPKPEERENRIQALREIRSFIKSGQVILSGLRSTAKFANFVPDIEGNSRVEDLMESALVAHERKSALLSDDFIQRVLATRLTCPSFCTQALLRSALAKKLISQSEYQDAVLRLHSWNYHFVSDNRETLLHLIKREVTPTTVLAQRVLTKLAHHSISSEGSRRVLLIFIFRLWSNSLRNDVSTMSWMPALWYIIERTGTRLNLVFRIISELPTYARITPKIFSRFIGFVCDSRMGDRRKACRLLHHAVNVATACSKTSELRFRPAWKKEAKSLRKALRIQNML